jgi:hypothetical protein
LEELKRVQTFIFHHNADSPLGLSLSHKLMTILVFPLDCHKHRTRFHLTGILGEGHDLALKISFYHYNIQ